MAFVKKLRAVEGGGVGLSQTTAPENTGLAFPKSLTLRRVTGSTAPSCGSSAAQRAAIPSRQSTRKPF
jgi:hypothetical protein